MAIYSDINSNFKINDKPFLSEDNEAIKEALENLFSTIFQERFFRPTFYTRLLQFLFEPINSETASDILLELRRVIHLLEPRISIDMERSSIQGHLVSKKYTVELHYTIFGLGQSGNTQIELSGESFRII